MLRTAHLSNGTFVLKVHQERVLVCFIVLFTLFTLAQHLHGVERLWGRREL